MSIYVEKFTKQWETKSPIEILYELFSNPEWDHLKNKAFVNCSYPISTKDFFGKSIILYEGSSKYISKEYFEKNKPLVGITGTYPRQITLKFDLEKSNYE